MARPNSKYFASVITKLIAAKRKENIVIDESFKMQLRSDVLTRAAGPMQEVPRPIDIGEFFAKWKYLFAAVPSALIVTLIAVQFVQMPVSIPSEQFVPTGTEQTTETPDQPTETDVSVQDNTQTEESGNEDVASGVSSSGKSKLRTFPGSFVLPQDVNTDGAVHVVTPDVTANNTTSTRNDNSSAENSSTTTPVSPLVPFNFLGLNQNVSGTQDDENNTTTAYREERFTREDENQPVDISSPVKQQPEAQLLENPVQVVSVEEAGSVQMADDATPLVNADPTVPDTTRNEPEILPVEPVRAITGGPIGQPVQDIQPAEQPQAMMAFVKPEPVVQYDVNLESKSRQILEKSVVPKLVDNRDVQYVAVSEQDGDVISVEVYFENGERVQKFYTFNERTQVWDKVTYVTNHYYDDSLQYRTDFVYTLSR